jgi:two-component system, response regulator YesN
MKIVIADDERLVRFALREMLEDMDLPFSIVGEASNGRELVSLVRQHKPDIAFVDIKMPSLDGLEAIKLCQEISENTQWIVLTGFPDFEYAKKSIHLGVSDYLLKPASPEEVHRALKPILLKSRKYLNACNNEFENEIAALFDDLIRLPENGMDSCGRASSFSGSIFIFDTCREEDYLAERKQQFCREVRKIIAGVITKDHRIALFVLPSGKLATVAASSDGNTRPAQLFSSELERAVSAFTNEHLAITEMRSGACKAFRELSDSFVQLQNLEFLRVMKPSATKVTEAQLLSIHTRMPKHAVDLCELLARTAEFFHAKDYLNCLSHLDRISGMLSAHPDLTRKDLLDGMHGFIMRTFCPDIQRNLPAADWLRMSRHRADQILSDKQSEKGIQPDLIDRVKAFMNQHYSEDLSIGQIASDLRVTPNYLSTLFHKRAGTTFVKHLTRLRMVKAKELLMSSSMRIHEVSEKLGYESSRHFARLFREFYGIYPSELLKKGRQSGNAGDLQTDDDGGKAIAKIR